MFMNSRTIFLSPLTLLIILMFLPSNALAATLTSTVNQNQISLNETLALTISYSEQVDNNELDLSVLEQDFDILSSKPQNSSRISIINGRRTTESNTTWNITLTPKRAGRLLIPAFSINGDLSKAITIQASAANNTQKGSSAKAAMIAKVTVNPTAAYLGQQVVINIELSIDKTVSNIRGEHLAVAGMPADLIDQKNFQRIDNGVARPIASWTYVFYPKEAGEFTIPAQTFTGLVNASRDFFGNFRNKGRQVFARSPAIKVSVEEPIANNDNTPWFPSESVTIESVWSDDKNQLKVGEPITRTINITAQGQPASAIPQLTLLSSSNDYKTYSDQPKLENMVTTSGRVGIRREAQAIIPSKEGTLTLPEQNIHWWNTNAKQWQVATLAAETLSVAPAINSNDTTQTSVSSLTTDTQNERSQQIDLVNTPIQTSKSNHWLWLLLTAILSVICLVQAWFIFKLVRKPTEFTTKTRTNTSVNEIQAWKQLLNVLPSNDANSIRNHLIQWSRHALPQQKQYTLHSLAKQVNNQELTEQFKQLDEHLYKGTPLNTHMLSQVLQQARKSLLAKQRQQNTKQTELAPLYPI